MKTMSLYLITLIFALIFWGQTFWLLRCASDRRENKDVLHCCVIHPHTQTHCHIHKQSHNRVTFTHSWDHKVNGIVDRWHLTHWPPSKTLQSQKEPLCISGININSWIFLCFFTVKMLIEEPVAECLSSLHPQLSPSSCSLLNMQLDKKMWSFCGYISCWQQPSQLLLYKHSLQFLCVFANAVHYVHIYCKVQINRQTLIDESDDIKFAKNA